MNFITLKRQLAKLQNAPGKTVGGYRIGAGMKGALEGFTPWRAVPASPRVVQRAPAWKMGDLPHCSRRSTPKPSKLATHHWLVAISRLLKPIPTAKVVPLLPFCYPETRTH